MINIIENAKNKILEKIYKKKNAPLRRKKIEDFCNKQKEYFKIKQKRITNDDKKSREKLGIKIAKEIGMYYADYGSSIGNHFRTFIIDVIRPYETIKPPYHGNGKYGLILIRIERKRIYRGWRPSYATTSFLIGKNEDGTFFEHPVSSNCTTVKEAISWIWNDKASEIIIRQGNIALCHGKKTTLKLPDNHKIVGNYIIHPKHIHIPLPYDNETIIIGRRASIKI